MPRRDPTRHVLSFVVPGCLETRTGGYIYDRRIIAGLKDLGWQVDVVSLDSSFPKPTRTAVRQAHRILGRLPDNHLAVIDGLAFGAFPASLIDETRRLQTVALVHHPLALETGLGARLASRLRESERESLAAAQRVVVTSRWTLRELGSYGVPSARIRVVEPGVDRPSSSRRRSRKQGRGLKMLCVATLTARKGHRVLVDALASLRDRQWSLRCVGSADRDAKTHAALVRQIESLALGGRIRLVGEMGASGLKREYERADLFVLASYLEGYGMVLTEALAHGLPVVSTRAGAIPHTVPRNSGLLVPAGDERSLARALARLLDRPAEFDRLARGAQAARRQLPTWKEAASRFDKALADLVARP